jgi:hypothetical protein
MEKLDRSIKDYEGLGKVDAGYFECHIISPMVPELEEIYKDNKYF